MSKLPVLVAHPGPQNKDIRIQMNKYKDALEEMVWQFGHRGVKNNQPIIWTGGLSALESAFEALGWEDPHYLPELKVIAAK